MHSESSTSKDTSDTYLVQFDWWKETASSGY